MVAEGNLGIISMWKTFKLYMLSTSSMLNRMRVTIKYQAQTVLGKFNLVKVILVTKGQKTEIRRIYNLKFLYRGTAGTKKQ